MNSIVTFISISQMSQVKIQDFIHNFCQIIVVIIMHYVSFYWLFDSEMELGLAVMQGLH